MSEEVGVDHDLKNKVVLIIGASGDIGYGISEKILNDTQAQVVLQYGQNKDKLIQLKEKFNERAHILQADLTLKMPKYFIIAPLPLSTIKLILLLTLVALKKRFTL